MKKHCYFCMNTIDDPEDDEALEAGWVVVILQIKSQDLGNSTTTIIACPQHREQAKDKVKDFMEAV